MSLHQISTKIKAEKGAAGPSFFWRGIKRSEGSRAHDLDNRLCGITAQCGVRKSIEKRRTHQALSLFPIDLSLGLGGHWRAKVRGWLHKGRVTEGGEDPGAMRPVFRLRHGEVG